MLCPEDFPFASGDSKIELAAEATISVPDHGLDFDRTVSQFERSILMQALEKTSGTRSRPRTCWGLSGRHWRQSCGHWQPNVEPASACGRF